MLVSRTVTQRALGSPWLVRQPCPMVWCVCLLATVPPQFLWTEVSRSVFGRLTCAQPHGTKTGEGSRDVTRRVASVNRGPSCHHQGPSTCGQEVVQGGGGRARPGKSARSEVPDVGSAPALWAMSLAPGPRHTPSWGGSSSAGLSQVPALHPPGCSERRFSQVRVCIGSLSFNQEISGFRHDCTCALRSCQQHTLTGLTRTPRARTVEESLRVSPVGQPWAAHTYTPFTSSPTFHEQ